MAPTENTLVCQETSRYSSAELYAMLGELAAELAHELNQPLAAIAAYADGAGRLLADDRNEAAIERARNIVAAISSQALRAGEAIEHMRRLVRHEPGQRVLLGPNDLLADASILAEPLARSHAARLQIRRSGSSPRFRGDAIRLQQLLMILVRNAVDAVADQPADRREIVLASAYANGRVQLSVSDTGPGIADSVMPHLFEAFYSTKPGGTGLGLAAGRSIAQEHGGELRVQNVPGGGACFSVELPPVHEGVAA